MAGAQKGLLPPHHQYRSFLDTALQNAVLEWTLANRGRFTPSETFKGVDLSRRVSSRLTDLGPLRTKLEKKFLTAAPDIFPRTGTSKFLIASLELELVAHGDGAHFSRHADVQVGTGRTSTGEDRIVSAVYYFHSEPKSFSGGRLRLHRFGSSGEIGDFVDIEPEQNSLVVFPSWAVHEVRKVICPSGEFRNSRFALNCWFKKLQSNSP
jgi:SM-20-related protein